MEADSDSAGSGSEYEEDVEEGHEAQPPADGTDSNNVASDNTDDVKMEVETDGSPSNKVEGDGAEGVVVVTVHNPEPPKLGVGSLRLALKRSRDLNATVP